MVPYIVSQAGSFWRLLRTLAFVYPDFPAWLVGTGVSPLWTDEAVLACVQSLPGMYRKHPKREGEYQGCSRHV